MVAVGSRTSTTVCALFTSMFGHPSPAFLGTTHLVGRRSYSSTIPLSGTNYLLKYEYLPDILERRDPHRPGHLDLAKRLIAEGTCLYGGPTGDPGMTVPRGALFIFTDEESAKLFAKEDPYMKAGLVTGHSIQEWNVVVQKVA